MTNATGGIYLVIVFYFFHQGKVKLDIKTELKKALSKFHTIDDFRREVSAFYLYLSITNSILSIA